MQPETPDGGTASPFVQAVGKQRILLVEDHVATLEVLARLLRRDGHEVLLAAAIVEAIAVSRGKEIDLLLSDLGLPDGSGNDLMVLLRKTHGVKGIALTGYGMEEDIAGVKAAGFSAHATKPVDLATLRRLIAEVILGRDGAGGLGGFTTNATHPGGPH